MAKWCILIPCLFLISPILCDWTAICPQVCECKWSSGKKAAICPGAGFISIPDSLSTEIQYFDLSYNEISDLPRDAFKSHNLLNIHKLYMHHCGMKQVHKEAFSDLSIMIELDLGENKLKTITPGTFQGNLRLRRLTLKKNPIQRLQALTFPKLPYLQRLDMSNCHINYIHKDAFKNLDELETLDISGNQLKSITSHPFIPLLSLKSLMISDNPWLCDCQLREFRIWLFDHNLYSDPTSCKNPERIADWMWDSLPADEFACKPNIFVPETLVLSTLGDNLTLPCLVTGNPAPNIQWMFNSFLTLNSTSAVNMTNVAVRTNFLETSKGVKVWSNLTVIHITELECGFYTCTGASAGGIVEANISVILDENASLLSGTSSSFLIAMGIILGTLIFSLMTCLMCVCCVCQVKKVLRYEDREKTPLATCLSNMGQNSDSETDKQKNQIQVETEDSEDNEREIRPCEMVGEALEASSIDPDKHELDVIGLGVYVAIRSPSTVKRSHSYSHMPNTKGFHHDNFELSGDQKNYPDLLPDMPNQFIQVSPETSSGSPASVNMNVPLLSSKKEFYNSVIVGNNAESSFCENYAANIRSNRLAAPTALGYSTLPRRSRLPSTGADSPLAKGVYEPEKTSAKRVYDTVGPRTTADGSFRTVRRKYLPRYSQEFKTLSNTENNLKSNSHSAASLLGSLPGYAGEIDVPHSRLKKRVTIMTPSEMSHFHHVDSSTDALMEHI